MAGQFSLIVPAGASPGKRILVIMMTDRSENITKYTDLRINGQLVLPKQLETEAGLAHLVCSISRKLPVDPVVASDDCIYERRHIMRHLSINNEIRVSPYGYRLTGGRAPCKCSKCAVR